jgi:hypothetical protein
MMAKLTRQRFREICLGRPTAKSATATARQSGFVNTAALIAGDHRENTIPAMFHAEERIYTMHVIPTPSE